MGDSTEFARKLITPYAERIEELEEEVENLKEEAADNRWAREFLNCAAERVRLANARSLVNYVEIIDGLNAGLRDLCAEMYRAARLLDANAHIEGMRVTDERREDWERRMVELGIEVSGK